MYLVHGNIVKVDLGNYLFVEGYICGTKTDTNDLAKKRYLIKTKRGYVVANSKRVSLLCRECSRNVVYHR